MKNLVFLMLLLSSSFILRGAEASTKSVSTAVASIRLELIASIVKALKSLPIEPLLISSFQKAAITPLWKSDDALSDLIKNLIITLHCSTDEKNFLKIINNVSLLLGENTEIILSWTKRYPVFCAGGDKKCLISSFFPNPDTLFFCKTHFQKLESSTRICSVRGCPQKTVRREDALCSHHFFEQENLRLTELEKTWSTTPLSVAAAAAAVPKKHYPQIRCSHEGCPHRTILLKASTNSAIQQILQSCAIFTCDSHASTAFHRQHLHFRCSIAGCENLLTQSELPADLIPRCPLHNSKKPSAAAAAVPLAAPTASEAAKRPTDNPELGNPEEKRIRSS